MINHPVTPVGQPAAKPESTSAVLPEKIPSRLQTTPERGTGRDRFEALAASASRRQCTCTNRAAAHPSPSSSITFPDLSPGVTGVESVGFALAGVECDLGVPNDALSTLEKIARMDNVSTAARYHVGIRKMTILYDQKRFDEQLACCDEFINNFPETVGGYAFKRDALCALNRPEEAVQAAREAVRRAPDIRETNRKMAAVLVWAGRSAEALRFIDRAIEIGPDDTQLREDREAILQLQDKGD